jgi:hypothetical protein
VVSVTDPYGRIHCFLDRIHISLNDICFRTHHQVLELRRVSWDYADESEDGVETPPLSDSR